MDYISLLIEEQKVREKGFPAYHPFEIHLTTPEIFENWYKKFIKKDIKKDIKKV